MPLSLAAEAEGVPSSTIYSLRDADPHVSAMLSRARANGAKSLAQKVLDGEKGSAMAGWMLERRYRDDYAPPRKEEVQPAEVRITIEGGLPPRPVVDQAGGAPSPQ
jgi:hypothetical protein